MTDWEALARAVQRATELIDDGIFEVGAHWHVLVAAAQERLTQLEGDVVVIEKEWTGFAEQQWPAETVDRIAKVLCRHRLSDGHNFECRDLAVAVLDALNEEQT